MNKELNLYSLNIKHKTMTGGGKREKYEESSDIEIVRKYRKKCLELKQENSDLKREIQKLKNDLEKKI